MKKRWLPVLLALVLTGCSRQETMETVDDVQVQPVAASIQQMLVDLPEETAVPVLETEGGTLYICADYTVSQQIMESGDLKKTVKSVSGFAQEDLNVLQTQWGDTTRYDFVWTAAGEQAEQVCRACILDDGNYHYVLTASTQADHAGNLQEVWREMFDSFRLVSPQMPLDTGS